MRLEIDREYLRSRLDQRLRDRAADPAGGTGDDRAALHRASIAWPSSAAAWAAPRCGSAFRPVPPVCAPSRIFDADGAQALARRWIAAP
jgi:hypothetical protein